MTKLSLIDEAFSIKQLEKIYSEKIKKSPTVGIDRVNVSSFEKTYNEQLKLIQKKVLNGSYRFTAYKEKLISKGRNSKPRVISIPTLRDKIVLKALHEILSKVFSSHINNEIAQVVIHNVKQQYNSDKYNYFIKLDIKNYYPSINHRQLLEKTGSKIGSSKINGLIAKAIGNKTIADECDEIRSPTVGVPQGLSVSNVLAQIYLAELDTKYKSHNDYAYFRYVDDILIFCDRTEHTNVFTNFKRDVEKLGLKIHCKKTEQGMLGQSFGYLGYVNTNNVFSIRTKSLTKLRKSIIKSFTQYRYAVTRNPKLQSKYTRILFWHLNLRITGCIFDEKKFGWMLYFSQVDDIATLFELDIFVKNMCDRFEVDVDSFELKRFVRTFHEITKNFKKTNYLPHFDSMETDEKRTILENIFLVSQTQEFDDARVEFEFHKRIYKSVRELERDINVPS